MPKFLLTSKNVQKNSPQIGLKIKPHFLLLFKLAWLINETFSKREMSCCLAFLGPAWGKQTLEGTVYQKDEAVDQHCVCYSVPSWRWNVLGMLSVQPKADWSFSFYLQAERHQKGGAGVTPSYNLKSTVETDTLIKHDFLETNSYSSAHHNCSFFSGQQKHRSQAKPTHWRRPQVLWSLTECNLDWDEAYPSKYPR